MAFQLKPSESIRDGIVRNVKHEVEKALDLVNAKPAPRARDVHDTEAVHEVRKCFKRVRAALRLVRDDLGNEVYHAENFGFRDAARPLTQVRDAQMLVETLDKLDPAMPKVRDALLANQRDVTTRVLRKDKALLGVKEFASHSLDRASKWAITRDGWPAIEGGLRRVYHMGHHALHRATENPSVENLHEWRKQDKYLWHAFQLLEPVWTRGETGFADQFHELSRVLGDDHDLAVLRQTLAADPLAYGGHPTLKELFVRVDARRDELERQAGALGAKIYKASPADFLVRFDGSLRAGKSSGSVPTDVARKTAASSFRNPRFRYH